MMGRITRDAPLVRSLRQEVPVPLEAIVAKMLARNPDDRYQTPSMVCFALTPFAKAITGGLEP
jgi:hypothetical protein